MIVKINEGTPFERVIGDLDYEYRIFRKNVSLSKHLFRKLDAWGIDGQYFTEVLLPNSYTVEVFEREEKRLYKTSVNKIKEHGVFLHFKRPGFENRAQVFMSRKHWEILTYLCILSLMILKQ